MNDRLTTLGNEIIDLLMASDPVAATYQGIHDHDHRLVSIDPDQRSEYVRNLGLFIEKLEGLKGDAGLVSSDSIDLTFLKGSLTADRIWNEQYRRWERDPYFPIEMSLYGCFGLVFRDFAPTEQRYEALIGRLKGVPGLLDQATANLKRQESVPTVWAEMAEQGTTAAIHFLLNEVPQLPGASAEQLQEVTATAREAAAAFATYLEFLKSNLTSRSRGSYALGAEGFDGLLESLHCLDLSHDDVAAIGEQAIADTTAVMDRLVERMMPGRSRSEVIAAVKEAGQVEDDLVDAYSAEVDSLRQFLLEHEIVTIPPDDHLEVVATPEFYRQTFPFAAYQPPAPFEDRQQGCMWVTPIDHETDPDWQKQQRLGQNRHSLLLVALHETYPGHHLQFLRASRGNSRIRRLAHSSLLAEGWALYCEQLMGEEGYFTDEATQLMQLSHQLIRACRVVIDVGLHTGGMSFTEAVELLVNVADLDRVNAIAEVKRYSHSPTQPMSYLVGKLELLKLKDAYRQQKQDSFNLREFHDDLLGYGTIPVSLLREAMLEQK